MQKIDHLWGFITGMMFGAGVFGHALRLVTLIGEPWGERNFVGIAGMVLYGAASILTWYKMKIGLWIAVIGPLIGLSFVAFGHKTHVDTFQIVLGIPQFLAIAVSIYMLVKLKKTS
jgi:hypothetical protein